MATPSSSFNSLGTAQEELDAAMGAMRNSMAMMAERDARLHSLDDKSHALQGTSGAFSRQAKRLRWEMRWQQSRMLVLAVALALWISCAYIFHNNLLAYFVISAVVFVLIYLVQRCVEKRLRAQLEPQDAPFLDASEQGLS
eukprot:TRINITY_DN10348_c0_g1_i1.p1 TRINITY_DN10348_c0_g1~~TRINITY_DN10348_c0_g1_i1.p1  ORF type:complete len:141 (+),score=34.40 TRINITY_DN10348_c0_g1_i1:40-462(+)